VTTERQGPGHVRRTLLALDVLAAGSPSAEELAMALGVHRRTAVRLLDVLLEAGWAEVDRLDPPRFWLTHKLVGVAGRLMSRTNLIDAGAPFVKAIRDRLDETSQLAVAAQGMALIIYEQKSFQPLAVQNSPGSRVPLYCSAVGKALAAHLPEQAELAVQHGLIRFRPNTIANAEAFAQQLERVRAHGYAVDEAEQFADIGCVAAPVRSGLGRVVASIGMSAPAARITSEHVADYARVVMEEAAKMSASLGYRDPGG
jgi:IclR family KDG regulon transcriptional repressor